MTTMRSGSARRRTQVFDALVEVHGFAFHAVRGVGASEAGQEEGQETGRGLGRPRAQGRFRRRRGGPRWWRPARRSIWRSPSTTAPRSKGGADDRGDVVERGRPHRHPCAHPIHSGPFCKGADLRSQLGAARLAGDDLAATALEQSRTDWICVSPGRRPRGDNSSRRHQLSFFVAAFLVAVFFAVVVFLAAVVFFVVVARRGRLLGRCLLRRSSCACAQGRPLARLSARLMGASAVRSSTVSARGTVTLVSPSVT